MVELTASSKVVKLVALMVARLAASMVAKKVG